MSSNNIFDSCRIYVCSQTRKNDQVFNTCRRYHTYDKYSKALDTGEIKMNSTTFLPVCKGLPEMFDRMRLSISLNKNTNILTSLPVKLKTSEEV